MRRTPRTIRHARFLAPLLAALLIGASTAAAVPAAETGGDAAAQGDFALQVYAPASGAFAVQPLADGVPVDALPTLRVPSANRSALPDPDDPAYAWLGTAGAAGWTTANAAAPDGAAVGPSFRVYPTATAAAPVTFGVSGITAPGSFAHYRVGNGNEASAPPREDGRYQFGTGVRSDGSAQGSTTTYSVSSQFRDGVSRFTAEGMYCVTFTAARGAETVSQEVRFAVGDTVADDAPCGTAADTPGVPEGPEEPGGGDDPGEPEEPEEPEEPGDGQDPGITVIENGHVDALYPELDVADDGTGHLALRARHQTLGTLDWDDFVLHSGQETQLRLPDTYTDDADYSFIADPGRTVWNSPQDGRSDGTTPWVGASTESPTLDGMPQAPVSVRLDAVTGPGGAEAPGDAVLWFQEAALLGKAGILYSTRTGLPGGYTWYLDSHAHFNWTFTAAGVYCMAFTVQARLPDGTLSQDSRQLTWAVGDVPEDIGSCGGTQEYPVSGPKPLVAGPDASPVLIEGGMNTLAARLEDGALSVGFRHEDPYAASPGFTSDIDDVIFHQRAGEARPYEFSAGGPDASRFTNPYLEWDATGVPAGGVDGGVRWEITDVGGPGDLSLSAYRQGVVFDTAEGIGSHSLIPGAETTTHEWAATAPGRYCVAMRWSAVLPDGTEVSDDHLLTLVVDGPLDPADSAVRSDDAYPFFRSSGAMFEHDATTLTETCADAAGSGEPGGPDTPGAPDDPADSGTPGDAGGPTDPSEPGAPDDTASPSPAGGTSAGQTASGGDSGGTGGDPAGGGSLASTGSGLLVPAGAAALLTLAGAAALAARGRWRRAGGPD